MDCSRLYHPHSVIFQIKLQRIHWPNVAANATASLIFLFIDYNRMKVTSMQFAMLSFDRCCIDIMTSSRTLKSVSSNLYSNPVRKVSRLLTHTLYYVHTHYNLYYVVYTALH